MGLGGLALAAFFWSFFAAFFSARCSRTMSAFQFGFSRGRYLPRLTPTRSGRFAGGFEEDEATGAGSRSCGSIGGEDMFGGEMSKTEGERVQ